MTLSELDDDMVFKLKQCILVDRNARLKRRVSLGELSCAGELVSDEDVRSRFGETEFSIEDFYRPS